MTALDDALASLGGSATSQKEGGGAALALQIAQSTKPKKKKHRGLFGGNLLQDAFDALSVPISAVTSTANQLSQAAGNLAFGAPQEGVGFTNWLDAIIDPEKQIHGADLIEGNADKGLSVGMFGDHGVYGHQKPSPLVKFIGGLTLDAAMDPLNFLGAAGEVHGAAAAAGHISDVAGLQIGKEMGLEGGKLSKEMIREILTKTKPIDEIVKVSPEQALRIEEIRNAAQDAVHAVRRGGASALTADQLERFGTFTNEVGKTRTLEKGMQLDFGRLGHIRLSHGESPLAQFSIIRHKAQMQLGDMLLGTPDHLKYLGRLNGSPELNAIARSGAARRTAEAPLSMMDATVIKRLRSSTRAIAETAAHEAQRVTNKALEGFSDDEINVAHDLIDGGIEPAAATARERELAGKLSAAFEEHGRKLVDAGVLKEEDLLKNGTYFPSPITKDARDAMIAAGLHPEKSGTFNNIKGFIEGQRKLWDPTTGEGGVGVDGENTTRIKFRAKTRAEAERKGAQAVAKKLKEAAELEEKAGIKDGPASTFLGEHPEAVPMMEKGEYPLFMQGREALTAQTRALGRRVAGARAGQKLFEQGYGLIDPRYAKGFVDYGPTADDVQRLLRLGGEASEKSVDRAAAAREMEAAIREREAELGPEGGAGGISPERPPEGPVTPSTPVAPAGATPEAQFAQAAGDAGVLPESAAAGNGTVVDATLHPDAPASDFDYVKTRPVEDMTLQEKIDASLRGETVPGVEDVVGNTERAVAEKVAAAEAAMPPKPEGMVRLFNSSADPNGGLWFSQKLQYSVQRGPLENLSYLDVTPEEARQMVAASTARGEGGVGIAIDLMKNPELRPIVERMEKVKAAHAAAAAQTPAVVTNVEAAKRGPNPTGYPTPEQQQAAGVMGAFNEPEPPLSATPLEKSQYADRLHAYNAERTASLVRAGFTEEEAASIVNSGYIVPGVGREAIPFPEATGGAAPNPQADVSMSNAADAARGGEQPAWINGNVPEAGDLNVAASPGGPVRLARVVDEAKGSVSRVNAIDAEFAPKGWQVTGDMPETAKRIVVTGGREEVHPGATRLLIRKLKEQYGDDITIVHGDARGVDKTFDRIAKEEGVAVEAHPANWKPNGPQGATDRGAGFKRNTKMATGGAGKADHVVPVKSEAAIAHADEVASGARTSSRIDATRAAKYKAGQTIEWVKPDGSKVRVVVDDIKRGIDARGHPTDGYVINYHLAENAKPDLGIVMPGGKGTAHMAGELKKAGVPSIKVSKTRAAGGAAPAATPAEKAYTAVVEGVTTEQATQNMNRVESVMDDLRAYMKNRTVFKGSAVAGKVDRLAVTEHFDQLTKFVKQLQLDEPSSFGYHDPMEAFDIPGFNPPGANIGGTSLQERSAALEKLLKKQISDFEAHPDVYAAKARARIEGHLAEEAQKAKVGAELPDTTLVPERRRPWTFAEKKAHKRAYGTVKDLGRERGKALGDVREAEKRVRIEKGRESAPDPQFNEPGVPGVATGPRRISQRTERADTKLRLLRDERAQLQRALEQKHALDVEDAARTAEQQAYESPVGTSAEMEGENLPRWADKNTMGAQGELTGEERRLFEQKMRAWQERNNLPIEHGEAADYARTRGGKSDYAAERDVTLTNDKQVDDEITRRIAALDDEISFMERTVSFGPDRPVSRLDIAEARLEDAKGRLAKANDDLESAKRALPEDRNFSPDIEGGGMEPTPGSAYEKVLTDMHEAIAKANARAIEPHLEGRERWVPGDSPFRDIETGITIKEGTLAGAAGGRIPKEVVAQRAKVIRERWRALGETVNDHSQAAEAWAAYKGKLDKAIPESRMRDMVASANTQIDQVGRMAQDPSHVASAVDDLVADADAVRGVSHAVIPEQVQINFDKRAMEGALWQQISEEATAAGDSARAEIAHMRIMADNLANDADYFHSNAEDWLNQWHSITTERGIHDAVGSLLVQGQIDWLKYTSLQRGILTPQGVAEALNYTERLATPEGEHRLGDQWRKALHWMRVWQITSPGFHIRNLFGGIFNNALYGVHTDSYTKFVRLWRKGATGAKMTEEETKLWGLITSAISPGQIGSEALGNPASRLLGESAISKTPWGQLGTHGVLPRVSENAGANVEFYLRGTLMYDTLQHGGSLESAVENVNKFHFDYHDASVTEQKAKANLIPFLTWTRHNVPLQLEMMIENPKIYSRFATFKRDVEATSDPDKTVPGYFADISAIRLPFTRGGGHLHYIPDLPFRDLGLVTEPIQQLATGEGDLGQRALAALGEPLSSTTPLASGPIEWMLGKQLYKGIPLRGDRGIKLHDLHIPEWLATPLRMTPLVKRGKNGQSYITERDFYVIEKMLPVLGRARRLGGSSETKQQNKFLAAQISFWAGTQVRTNTEEDQKIANYLSTLETKRQKTIDNGLSG